MRQSQPDMDRALPTRTLGRWAANEQHFICDMAIAGSYYDIEGLGMEFRTYRRRQRILTYKEAGPAASWHTRDQAAVTRRRICHSCKDCVGISMVRCPLCYDSKQKHANHHICPSYFAQKCKASAIQNEHLEEDPYRGKPSPGKCVRIT